jgi:hypothetical protein
MSYLKTFLNILLLIFLPYYLEIYYPWFDNFTPDSVFYKWMFGFVRLELLVFIVVFIYNVIKVLSEQNIENEQ